MVDSRSIPQMRKKILKPFTSTLPDKSTALEKSNNLSTETSFLGILTSGSKFRDLTVIERLVSVQRPEESWNQGVDWMVFYQNPSCYTRIVTRDPIFYKTFTVPKKISDTVFHQF